jgi:serine/threonine protein kinase
MINFQKSSVTPCPPCETLASVFHLGKTGQNYVSAKELVEGETLANLVRRSGKVTLEIAAKVAAGFAAVHRQKLVHRDFKRISSRPSPICNAIRINCTNSCRLRHSVTKLAG